MKKDLIVQGTIITTRKGMGYIKNPENPENDIVVEIGFLNTALNGDIVEVKLGKINSYKQQTGEVIRIIKRARDSFVCVIDSKEGVLTAYPDDKKAYASIRLSPSDIEKVSIGDKVYVKMKEWTNPKVNPEGDIVRILGKKGNNNVEMESIVLEKGFEINFPDAVEKEANEIERNKDIDIAKEIPKRKDFRHTLTFTIDPFDAKDFDDAISIKDLKNGNYEIGVHIADVSHYVEIGSALDKEALKRGCSIYLVDRTIPMLPEVLSNDVCSLNPHEDKLTFSAWFVMNDKDEVIEKGERMIVITGASDGLGRQLARIYQDSGKTVVNIARRKCEFADHNILFNLREGADIEKAAKSVLAIDEPLEALVNCAGVLSIQPLGKITEDEVKRVMSTNVKSAILLVSNLTDRYLV
jgi:ribonuclease R